MFLGNFIIFWNSKKQNHVSKSFNEVEYQAIFPLCSNIIWLDGLLSELGFL